MTAPPLSRVSQLVLGAVGISKSVTLPNRRPLALLTGVDLSVRAGESVAIVGTSGSGKSTLLSLLGILTQPTEGTVSVCGQDSSRLSDAQRAGLRNRRIGFVFQSYSLVRHLTAAENVELPLRYGRAMGRQMRRRRVSEMLDLVGLADRVSSRPRMLSGGEQQRVAIARALVRRPPLILADEPTGALDVKTASGVLDVLLQATEQRGAALLLVTHDPAVAARMSRVLTLQNGALWT